MEPAQPPLGSYKTARKGAADYVIKVEGLAAHAGADHEKGINALEELAHQILTVQGFTDYTKGTTFNVGIVHGGTRVNVVPANAYAQIDVRFMLMSERTVVEEKMRNLKTHLAGVKMEIQGSMDRPPMERTPQIVALFTRAQKLARIMGIELTEAAAGGGSDGNLTAAMGIPTLDGMGVVGDGGHSISEYAEIASLPERAAILAALLCSE
jgi:glutamate carboxypeptidase